LASSNYHSHRQYPGTGIIISHNVIDPYPCHLVFRGHQGFEREYTYQASEADSKLSSRTISLAEVKRLLLEELGTYLESVTEIKNFQLTNDQITALTAGIVKVEVLDERWDGKTYWVKARLAADPEEVSKSIARLRKDREKMKDLEAIKRQADRLLAENKRLRTELERATGKGKEPQQEAFTQGIRELNAIEWFQRGFALSQAGDERGAINAFTKAIAIDPQFARAYYQRSLVYSTLGNTRQAIADLDQTIALDPKNAKAYGMRASNYERLGNREQALRDYDRAIEINPRYADAYLARGLLYDKLGMREQAMRDFRSAARLGHEGAINILNMYTR